MIGLRVTSARAVARPALAARLRSAPAARSAVLVRAAEEAVDNAFVYGEEEAPATPAPSTADAIPLPTYHLNILYLDKAIGIAVDQKLASGERGPVTEYFMWPAKDAWEQLKVALEGMPWISQNECILLLNDATNIINYWQDEEAKHTIDDARAQFDSITFFGA